MAIKLNSYINFNGNGRAALDFYQSIFGGSVESDTFKEFNEKSGGSMPMPEEDADKLMHASLTAEHLELMISDVPSTWPPAATESNITLALNGDDEATLRRYWEQLSEGGAIVQPLESAPWGDIFGSLTDKFGVTWMIDIVPAGEN